MNRLVVCKNSENIVRDAVTMTQSPKWHLHTANLTIINNKFKWLLDLKGKQENPHIREAAVIEPAGECDFLKLILDPAVKHRGNTRVGNSEVGQRKMIRSITVVSYFWWMASHKYSLRWWHNMIPCRSVGLCDMTWNPSPIIVTFSDNFFFKSLIRTEKHLSHIFRSWEPFRHLCAETGKL